ncbi:MAG: hypothetical protein LBB65_08260 [Burkholderiales bacterium]|jgi:hypothetical protein|nr:hypothetical protein [Burkholderiales bacterium]
MADLPDAPPSSPSARKLFEGVDALMRRNRRLGTEPLPPPEGQPVTVESRDSRDAGDRSEVQHLPAESLAESAPVADMPEERVPEEIPQAAPIDETNETPIEPVLPASPEQSLNESAEACEAESDQAELWQAQPESLETEPEIVQDDAAETAETQAAPETVTGAVMETAPEAALEIVSQQMEDDLLLWEFAPRQKTAPQTAAQTVAPEVKAAAEAVAEPEPAEVVEAMEVAEVSEIEAEAVAEALVVPPSFSEAVSFLSTPEVLPPASQSSAAYTASSPKVSFGVAAKEDHAAAPASRAVPEIFAEDAALSEEVLWLLAEETDETPPALDSSSEMDVAEALAPLSGAKVMPEAAESETAEAEDASRVAPETEAEAEAEPESSGLWYLVESEMFPEEETPVSEAPETAEVEAAEVETIEAADAEETIDEETELPWFLSTLEAPEAESAAKEEAQLEALEETKPEEAEALAPTEPALAEPTLSELALNELTLAKPELEAVQSIDLSDEAALSPAFEKQTSDAGAEADADLFIEPQLSEAKVEAAAPQPLEILPETPPEAPPKMPLTLEEPLPVSAATLLSEQRRREDEAEAPSSRYSAAQLLAEYQSRRPQAQNGKAAATPPPVRVQPLPDEHDSLSTFNEPVRRTKDGAKDVAKAKPAARAAPPAKTPPPKKTSLELTIDALADAVEHSAEPADLSSGEDDYYPVLTDVVSEGELLASNRK